METNQRTPSDLINFIGKIILERQEKKMPTFYTISIEQYDKFTPMSEKEEGYDNFRQQILKYTSDFNLTALKVDLYSGKSRNVKTPFQTFKVVLKKQNPTVFLGNSDKEPAADVQQLDSSISVHRYYDEKFGLQIRIMQVEMEKQALTDRVIQITERYEEKLKDQETRNQEKTKLLLEEIDDNEEVIKELEKEIANNEKGKHNSFGNIALGSIGVRMVEGLAKSDMGQGVLKGLLGQAGYETLQGHLAGIENEKNNATPEKPSGRIISEPEATPTDPRQVALNYIQRVGQALPDMLLRMLYDIAEMTEKRTEDLEVLWKVAQQIKQQRKQQPTTTETESEEQEDEDSNQTDTNQIP